MGHTGAYQTLVKKRPSSSLVAAANITSLLIHIVFIIGVQALAFVYLSNQPWYEQPVRLDDNSKDPSMATSTIFYVSCFQYLMLAFALSKGPPYRLRIWTNVPFLITLIVLTVLTFIIVVSPPKFVANVLLLHRDIPLSFREVLLGISLINLLLVLLLESFVADSETFKQSIRAHYCRDSAHRNTNKIFMHQVLNDHSWPPIGETTTAGFVSSPATVDGGDEMARTGMSSLMPKVSR
jgi:magnesium-transporting ATPase (P-type)